MFRISRVDYYIQSPLVILKSMWLTETLRDIRTSTYQICRIEENTYRTTKFHKWTCNLTPLVRNMLKILWKRREIAPKEQFLLLSTIFSYLMLDFYVNTKISFFPEISVIQDNRSRDNESRLYFYILFIRTTHFLFSLISQSKFFGTWKFTLRYQKVGINLDF